MLRPELTDAVSRILSSKAVAGKMPDHCSACAMTCSCAFLNHEKSSESDPSSIGCPLGPQWDMLWGEAKYEWGYSQPNINWSATRGKPDGTNALPDPAPRAPPPPRRAHRMSHCAVVLAHRRYSKKQTCQLLRSPHVHVCCCQASSIMGRDGGRRGTAFPPALLLGRADRSSTTSSSTGTRCPTGPRPPSSRWSPQGSWVDLTRAQMIRSDQGRWTKKLHCWRRLSRRVPRRLLARLLAHL